MEKQWLPMTQEEVAARGWERVDFALVTGDAYVDHPSFGAALIARVLESEGFRVGVIAQPDWRGYGDISRFGRPRLGFMVTAGCLDSMVNHFTAGKKPRSGDEYAPGGKAGLRPNRASIVYCNLIRQKFRRMPIILGGLEASLRRFAHYDYWDDAVRRSVLVDSGADLLVYGMAEKAIVDIARAMDAGVHIRDITQIGGTCFMADTLEGTGEDYELLPSFDEVAADKSAFARAFARQERAQVTGTRLVQAHGKRFLITQPPQPPLSTREMDAIYALPFAREAHPSYKQDIPALEEVRFSLTHNRGCLGACAFCAISSHQGRVMQHRSHNSLLSEARVFLEDSHFKGYIHDVGGPTANFRLPACELQVKGKACPDRQCISHTPCKNLRVTHTDYLSLLRKLRELPGVKKVFVRSGLRFDYLLLDKNPEFFKELVEHHISGQLKVAPEHACDDVLAVMGKPPSEVFERFRLRYTQYNNNLGKEQYLVPYFVSSHPGCTLEHAIALACYLHETSQRVEQVQDFYPTPGTKATCMYHTGLDPDTMSKVYIARSPEEKRMQRALLQPHRRENAALVLKALRAAGRDDLIGSGKHCLVRGDDGEALRMRMATRGAKADKTRTVKRDDKAGKAHIGKRDDKAGKSYTGKREDKAGKSYTGKRDDKAGKARSGKQEPKAVHASPSKSKMRGAKKLSERR